MDIAGDQVPVDEASERLIETAQPFEDAATMGEGIDGNVKVVIDEDLRTLVGATFVGPGAGEMIHAATIAIVGKVTIDELWHATPAFPTISEFWLRILEAYGL